jgi:hypothetical protein
MVKGAGKNLYQHTMMSHTCFIPTQLFLHFDQNKEITEVIKEIKAILL